MCRGWRKHDLKKCYQTVQPLADQIFQAPAGTYVRTRKAQLLEEVAQAKEIPFPNEETPAAQGKKTDTYLIILNAKFEPVLTQRV